MQFISTIKHYLGCLFAFDPYADRGIIKAEQMLTCNETKKVDWKQLELWNTLNELNKVTRMWLSMVRFFSLLNEIKIV